MIEISSVTAASQKPSLHVAVVGAFRIGDREEKTLASIEKSRAQDVSAGEGEQPAHDSGDEPYPFAGSNHLLRAQRRVGVGAPDCILDPHDGMMHDHARQPPDGAVQLDLLVDRAAAEAPFGAPE